MSAQSPEVLRQKVVVVTGAASGIGLHAVKGFLAEGARVAMVDSDEDSLRNRVQELTRVSGRDHLLPLCCDYSDDALNSLGSQVIGHWGCIDVLVNNASVFMGGSFVDQSAARLRQMVDVNLYATMRLTQIVVPQMIKQGGGQIVNVYSSTAELGVPGFAGYAAATAGLSQFTRVLRRELVGKNILLTSFCPGLTDAGVSVAALLDGGASPQHLRLEIPAAELIEAVKQRKRHVVVAQDPMRRALLAFVDRLFPSLLDGFWARKADQAFYAAAARIGSPAAE